MTNNETPSLYVSEMLLTPPQDTSSLSRFPWSLPALQNVRKLKFTSSVTFLVGENGTGKSTLLEAIADVYGFNPEGGSKNFHFSTFAESGKLASSMKLGKTFTRAKDGYFLRAESFYNVASEIDKLDSEGGGAPLIGAYGGKSLHEQSHGESFLSLLVHRFKGNGLYILDEPEAALSPMRQLAMIARIHQLCALNSQFIIATHSPILLAYPGATIYLLDDTGVRKVGYEETEHYQVARGFLENPEGILRELFANL